MAQACNADTRDHRRVAKEDRRAGETVEEPNSGTKKNRRDVDVDFVATRGRPDGKAAAGGPCSAMLAAAPPRPGARRPVLSLNCWTCST